MTPSAQAILDEINGRIPDSEHWRIDIPKIPKEANYHGAPHATILKRTGDFSWDGLGYLMLSANPECASSLQELVILANECLERRAERFREKWPTFTQRSRRPDA